MDKNLKKLAWYAAAIRVYEIWMFYLYMRASWGIESPLHNPSAPQGLVRFWFFILIAEIAYYYLLVRFQAVKKPGIGIKIAQAAAVLIFMPMLIFSFENIKSYSLYYNLTIIVVNSVVLFHFIINNRCSWKYFKRLKPKAGALRSR